MITAPFNFVPLSEKVFFPNWADRVSHDIPFSDGESGEIEITITAKSPIFIRDHKEKEEFCHHIYPNGKKEYYIPATSVKGMVRNVLEIMSFSKMSFFNDDTYAVRDMSDSQNFYMKEMKKSTFCGWLKKKDNGYVVEDCGTPARIRQDELDNSFATYFKRGIFDEKVEYNKTAEYKYEMLKDIKLTQKFSYKKKDNGKEIYIIGDEREGTIVLTGQSSGRKEGKDANGKIYEFIFFKSNGEELIIEEEVFDNFKFAYFDGRKTQPIESSDWTYWKKKLENDEEVPVFFQKDNQGKIKHFGLSYLYKLPYKYSIKNAIETVSKEHFDKRADLAETIFGFIDEDSKKALKGRVQFSHFKADTKPPIFKTITTVLGSPRASYYPIYMKQDCRTNGTIESNEYNTLMSKKTEIRGRKRYPIQQKIPNPTIHQRDEKSSTTFQPLGTYDKESKLFNEFTFSGKLRYHNLRKAELGAIISALTFHGNSEEFYHSIGMAKPYGFGKISIDIDMSAKKQIELLQTYEELMKREISNNWLETEQIKELFSMASKGLNIDDKLKYLILDPTKSTDEFREHKNSKRCLPLITKLKKVSVKTPSSLFDAKIIESFIEKENNKMEQLKKEKEETRQQQELLNQTPKSFSKEFKKAIENYIKKSCKDLPYYDYNHLKLVLNDRADDIISDDIYYAYEDLEDMDSFKKMRTLLIKRDKNKATDLELAELYNLLIKG